MKVLLMLLLSLISFNTFAVEAKAVIQQGYPFVTWPSAPNFTYTLLRRTIDTSYEVIASDLKGGLVGSFRDLDAEPNVQYFYNVAANSKDIKLDVATELLKSFPLGPAADFEKVNSIKHVRTEDSIVFTSTKNLERYEIKTDIIFDVNKRYVVKFHLGQVTPKASMHIAIGGVPCTSSSIETVHLVQFSNSTYECMINPSIGVRDFERSFYNNNFGFHFGSINGVGTVEIKKIDIWGFEN